MRHRSLVIGLFLGLATYTLAGCGLGSTGLCDVFVLVDSEDVRDLDVQYSYGELDGQFTEDGTSTGDLECSGYFEMDPVNEPYSPGPGEMNGQVRIGCYSPGASISGYFAISFAVGDIRTWDVGPATSGDPFFQTISGTDPCDGEACFGTDHECSYSGVPLDIAINVEETAGNAEDWPTLVSSDFRVVFTVTVGTGGAITLPHSYIAGSCARTLEATAFARITLDNSSFGNDSMKTCD